MTKTIKLYATRDDKLSQFNVPFTLDNDAVAIRSFGDAIKNAPADSILKTHPEDVSIWFIGEYNVETAFFNSVEPVCLARGSDFKE